MIVKVPVSLGELVDKISILSIKLIKIKNNKKSIDLIKDEHDLLINELNKITKYNTISKYYDELKKVNEELWNVEDKLRLCENTRQFDQAFVDLARSVYLLNDRRALIKKDINLKFNSKIVEVKSYENY